MRTRIVLSTLLMTISILWLAGFANAAEDTKQKSSNESMTNEQSMNSQAGEDAKALRKKLDEALKRIEALEEKEQEREIEALKSAAKAESVAGEESGDELTPKTFKGGARSLQALNPELSVTGDFFARGVIKGDKEYIQEGSSAVRSGAFIRGLGLHIQSNLDPFSYLKAAISFSPNGVGFGEAYVVFTSILPRTNLMLGKFRQQFGVVNRWHKHGLDQFDFPLPLMEIFGEGGLNQVGASLDITLPALWAKEEGITLQITNAMNPKILSGSFFSIPAGLLHMNNYWDLSRNTYLEIGFTGLFGTNNKRGYFDAKDNRLYDEPLRYSAVGGVDMTLNWEPVNQAKYRGFTWRSEFYYAYKQIPDPNNSDDTKEITTMGAYSYMQYKFMRNWIVGVRGDYSQPFKLENSDEYIYQVVPYVTWWQSPWVRFRLEYQFKDGSDTLMDEPVHTVLLQLTFAAGPHKHDRY